MNYDFHILLACLIGVVFAGLLLAAAGDEPQSPVLELPKPKSSEKRRAA